MLNAALYIAFTVRPRLAPPSMREFFIARTGGLTSPAAPEAAPPRAQPDRKPAPVATSELWATLYTDDLPTFISRLRAAGFSPAVIRAIANAQIEARFAERMRALAKTATDTPFWKTESPVVASQQLSDATTQIYRERSRLLRELLGHQALADNVADAKAAQRRQYGDLSKEKIDVVNRVSDDYAEMIAQARAAMRNVTLPEDLETIAFLEREKKADLATILTPEELEAYEMRSSTLTARLRTAMTLLDASEDEFRAIYRIQLPFNEIINPTGGIGSTDAMEKRRTAQETMDAQLQAALGDARFTEYRRASNNEYQQLTRLGARENIPAEAMNRAFDLRKTTTEESMRIYSDTSLNYDQKLLALQSLGQSTRSQLVRELGATTATAYADANARWLTYIEQGRPVSITADNSMTIRTLPRTPPPPVPTK